MAGVKGQSGRKPAGPKMRPVKATAGTPKMPGWLPKNAVPFWNHIENLLKEQTPCQLSVTDEFGMATLATALWRQSKFVSDIDKASVELPELTRQLKCVTDDIKYWCHVFYLEPTARAKSKVPHYEVEPEAPTYVDDSDDTDTLPMPGISA